MFARIALSLVFAVGAVGAGAGTYAPPKGTVLYYPFDTPETALDSFGTAPGRLSAADGNVAFSAEGRFGGCLRFSGKDVLELRNLPDAMPLGTGAVTVVTWIRADGKVADRAGWIGYGERRRACAGLNFRNAGPGRVRLDWNGDEINVTTPDLADGAWHQVAVTWDGTVRTAYYDGRPAGSDRRRPNVRRDRLLIGSTNEERPTFYKGWLDEVLIASRAFTADEIAALYAEGVRRVDVTAKAADDGRVLVGDRFVDQARATAVAERTLTVDGRWLLMPVRSCGRQRKAEIFDGDRLFRTIQIEFAPGEPDWYARLDVSSLKGRKLTFKLEDAPATPDGLNRLRISNETPVADGYDGKYRPQFHFTPYGGGMNDPNGLSYYNGEWHLFYQYNPYSIIWAPKHWGHAVSRDLVHWEEVGIALYPDALGDMWSGSAVVDRDNTAGFGKNAHILVFTGTANGSTQSIAWSLDGRTYEKYAGNPVLPRQVNGNRDPHAFWYEPEKCWMLAVCMAKDERHCIGLFRSADLKDWKPVGTIPGDPVRGGDGFLNDCPDMFEMQVEGEETKRWVVLGGNGTYSVGTFDGRNFVAEADRIPPHRRFGGYYAQQTFACAPGGRRVAIAWFQVKMPGMPFDQAYSLPCELKLARTPAGLRLLRFPVRELESLRDGPAKPFADFEGELVEAFVEFRPAGNSPIALSLRGIRMRYDPARELLEVPGGTVSWPLEKGWFRARVFIDRTGMETFSLDGSTCLPSQDAIAEQGDLKLRFTEGGDRILEDRSRAYRLKGIWGGG